MVININKNEKLVNLLIEKKYHISAGESCTGGQFISEIVSIPNASMIFDNSFVTYSNESKIKYLSVNKESIEKFGVVSEEVAKEMALGAIKATGAEVGVGISGIAGPTGGSEKKPVGMVCFGIVIKNKSFTFTKHFKNQNRNQVRKSSVDFIIDILLEKLLEN